MRVLCAAVWLLGALAAASPGVAQQALGAANVRMGSLEPLLTLRPEPGLRELAHEVAAVLELRTGQRVEVSHPPPPDLLEAVPAGHVAMAMRDGAVVLVLGAPGGRSLDATVQISGAGASDARAVALAAEDLRDTSIELARGGRIDASDAPAGGPAARTSPARDPSAPPDDRSGAREGGGGLLDGGVDPLVFVRLYGGASTRSEAFANGLGAGVGLCVRMHCLVLGGEVPILRGSTTDLRYRYTTFTSGFYSRPLANDHFALGASLGFLTRVGHFQQDMGLADEGLDTDLGARGSLELDYTPVEGFDVMLESGADFTIDRHLVYTDMQVMERGDRLSPWAQLALRVRPSGP